MNVQCHGHENEINHLSRANFFLIKFQIAHEIKVGATKKKRKFGKVFFLFPQNDENEK